MVETQTLDVDALTLPISEASPVGTDLRLDNSFTSIYHQVKNARNDARTYERKSLQEGIGGLVQPIHPSWTNVYQLSIKALMTLTKDLEFCAWLIESAIRLDGFDGLKKSLNVLKGLLNQYWDDIFPLPGDDIEQRVIPLIGIAGSVSEGTLIMPIKSVPITEGTTLAPYALWQYLAISNDSKDTETLAALNSAIDQSSAQFYIEMIENLEECLSTISAIDLFLQDKCSIASPSFADIKEQLAACLKTVQTISKDKIPPSSPIGMKPVEGSLHQMQSPDGPINDREHALAMIKVVAHYFQQAEPHSPLSYLLEKAYRWGAMSLPNLLKELITDGQTFSQLAQLIGIEAGEAK